MNGANRLHASPEQTYLIELEADQRSNGSLENPDA
jgi:hypothetical protein